MLALFATSTLNARVIIPNTAKTWQGGIGLGNVPIRGSFKTSLSGGYHITNKWYVGVVYQFGDEIKKKTASFNAKSADLGGLVRSTAYVGPRAMIQARYAPFKCGAYISGGIINNGDSWEDMSYDVRSRTIAGDAAYTRGIRIRQSKPSGWGLALGLGYQHNFTDKLSANIDLTPAWFQRPKPTYQFITSPPDLSDDEIAEIESRMNSKFKSRMTNYYTVFHIGVAYRFNI